MVLARLHDAYSMDASYTNSLQELTQTTFREIFLNFRYRPVLPPARWRPKPRDSEKNSFLKLPELLRR